MERINYIILIECLQGPNKSFEIFEIFKSLHNHGSFSNLVFGSRLCLLMFEPPRTIRAAPKM